MDYIIKKGKVEALLGIKENVESNMENANIENEDHGDHGNQVNAVKSILEKRSSEYVEKAEKLAKDYGLGNWLKKIQKSAIKSVG